MMGTILTYFASMANAFSYWQAQEISNATEGYFDDIQQALSRVQSVSGSLTSIEFWTGETGWPSTGKAKPLTISQQAGHVQS